MTNKAALLQKIKSLADSGIDGEKENAQVLLDRLMKKYDISEAEIEADTRKTAWFEYKHEYERRLLIQIIYMATGAPAYGCVGAYTQRKRKKMGTDATVAERLEIEAAYAFYKVAMEKELDIFYAAFAHKNKLFPPPEKIADREEKSHEDTDRAVKIGLMMEGMDRHILHKQITSGGGTQ